MAKCTHCGEDNPVLFELRCKDCGSNLDLVDRTDGRLVHKCPKCGFKIVLEFL